jgi:hypothetical protein
MPNVELAGRSLFEGWQRRNGARFLAATAGLGYASAMATGEPRPLPRSSLASLSLLHAAIFTWVAIELPWRSWTLFSCLTALLALLHLVTAVAAAWQRHLRPIWRLQAVMSLAWLAYVGWGTLSSAWYLGALYAGLGKGLALGLMAAFGLVVLVTVPQAAWGLAATGGVRLGRRGALGVLGLLALVASSGWRIGARARGDVLVAPADRGDIREAVDARLDPRALPRVPGRSMTVFTTRPAICPHLLGADRLTLFVSFVTAEPTGDRERVHAETRCVQAPSQDALAAKVSQLIQQRGRFGPIKLDLVHGVGELPDDDEPLAPLALRPGLDGICSETRCLLPWQLVATSSFVEQTLLPSVPDARIGFSPAALRARLGSPRETLRRIATTSWLVDPIVGRLAFGRSQAPEVMLDGPALQRAALNAQQYIMRAQREDGRFNYLVDPFSGKVTMGALSVARQAGTTLALCELAAPSRPALRAIRRSLALITERAAELPDDRAIIQATESDGPVHVERVGPSALALAALLTCRPHLGPEHDALIARLGRTLVHIQRTDGGFAHHVEMSSGRAADRPASLYVDGQIVLALVLLDGADLGPSLQVSIERAMTHFSTRYWHPFLANFFYLEENWHCLAARAALAHHRHDGYERFCIDYVTMKSRFQLDRSSGVHPDFLGGVGLGNLVPPHNTATAGLGEALAAAIVVANARGEDSTSLQARLRDALGFLLRTQWQRGRCFACTRKLRIIGGFSEHMASPAIRIDYVQHAWAALGHGARALGMDEGV